MNRTRVNAMSALILTVFAMGVAVGGILTALAAVWVAYFYDRKGDRHNVLKGKHWNIGQYLRRR